MTATVTLADPATQELLGRSAIYELLSLSFTYPDAASLAELDAYLADVLEHPIAGALGLGAPLRELRASVARVEPVELAGEHLRLFAGEVLCSACETEYAFDPFAKSRQLADIAGFYRAFGLEVAPERRGTPDGVAVELEFLGLLLRKQAYAAARGWTERAGVAERAIHAFLEDHLGGWADVLCTDLRREAADRAGFYGALAELCARFVAVEVARAGVLPDRVRDRSRAPQDAVPFSCPLAREPADAD